MESWIRIHRSMIDWEWWDDARMVKMFLYLIMSVNYKDKKWHGIEVKRGQIATSRQSLSKILNMSEREVRTCLERLKTTKEIAIETTKQYTLVSVLKYDDYQPLENPSDQETDQGSDQQTTSERPTSDQQPTTTKESKKDIMIESKNTDTVGGEGGARTHAPEGAPTPDPNANAGGEENPEVGKTAETPQGNPQTPPQDPPKDETKDPKDETKEPPKPPTIGERKLAFGQSLVPFVEQYGASLIRDFYDYWTEPNQSKTRLKFEMEKTWDTSRRLKTWVRREDEYAKEKTSGGKGGGYVKPKKENPIDTFNSVFGGSDDELKQEAEVAIWTEVL